MENLKEKPMGQAIRNYFPKAFVLHQDVMFRVDGPAHSGLPGITPNQDLSREIMKKLLKEPGLEKKIWNKIIYELGVHGFDTGPIEDHMNFDGEPEDGDYVNVIVPAKIDLRLDKGLNVGRCRGCGHLNYFSFMPHNSKGLPIHSSCTKGKKRYSQAPVFVPYPDDESTAARPHSTDQLKIQTVIPKDVNCIHFKPGKVCDHPDTTDHKCVDDMDGQHSYMTLGPNYPLKGIKIVNNLCPKGLKNIKPRNMTKTRSGTEYHYKTKFAETGITGRLYTTVAMESENESETIQSINNEINETKIGWFKNELVDLAQTKFARITAIDLVYGRRIGGYYDHDIKGERGKNNVVGRMLETQGFVIAIREGISDVATELVQYDDPSVPEKDKIKDKVKIITHTLEHAILNQIPTFTGMDENMFGSSYEIEDEGKGAKIYLYDNEVGGHGGFGTLMADGDRFSRLIENVYKAIKCPIRKCRIGCKHCLFIRNCGLSNNKINRRMLIDSEILQQQM